MNAVETMRDRLIVAYDFPSVGEALDFDRRVGPAISWVKVGLELFVASGPGVVTTLKERGRRVFLDLKLHDIPNTVAGAVRSATGLGADLLTLHAEGGPEMMRAAVEARGDANLKLLAVTVLTSLDGKEYPEVYREGPVQSRVIAFARAAEAAGVDGVVCSPLELGALAGAVGKDFLRVTPGIRPAGAGTDDQARAATPGAAIGQGASHLVVGRPITRAEDPRAAAEAVLGEMGHR